MSQDKIAKMRAELNSRLIERKTDIDIILACLVSSQHAFLFGPPGCGKSLMIRILRDMIGDARYFEILMAASTRPIELCGPPSLSKLSSGEYHVETEGYLPWAHIAFLDEIWKANSAILNTLLTLINERRFKNGKNIDKTPLLSLFGASNELPEDDSLGALDDRFVARLVINPVTDRESFKSIMRMNRTRPASPEVVLSLDDILKIQADVAAIPVSDAFDDALFDVRTALFKEFGPSFILSERRLAMITKLAQGLAYVLGLKSVETSLLPKLTCCFWKELSQIPTIQTVLDGYASAVVRTFLKKVQNEILTNNDKLGKQLSEIQAQLNLGRTGKDIASKLEDCENFVLEFGVSMANFIEKHLKSLSKEDIDELVKSDKYWQVETWIDQRLAWTRSLYTYLKGQGYNLNPNIKPAPNTVESLKAIIG